MIHELSGTTMSVAPLESPVSAGSQHASSQRRHYSKASLEELSCGELLTLEESTQSYDWEKISRLLPVILR